MNKCKFYPRLALVNVTRNAQFYLPYLLSCGGTAAMYYMVVYLSRSEIVASVRGAGYLQSLMILGTGIVALFSIILLLYANGFVMKRRRKELGLYNVLGMEKRHIAHLMFWETLLCAFCAIAGGIAVGILLSKFLLLLLMRLVRLPVAFGFEISSSGIVQTAVLFGILFLLTFLYNLVRIGRASPIELLHSDSAGEREPRVKWPLVVVGLLTLLGGYFLALTVKTPVDALALFFVAVFLVIIGTFCLFTTGSIAALKALRRNKRFYYHPKHFTAVSGMLYRMKQNAVGLANICILSTMVLVTVSTTVCLYLGLDGTLNRMYPHDLQITQECQTGSDPDASALLQQAETLAAESGRSITSQSHLVSSSSYALFSGNAFLFSYQEEQPGTLYRFTVITAEEYNRLTGQNTALQKDEVLIYTSEGDMPNTIYLKDQPFRVAGRLDIFLDQSRSLYSNMAYAGLVVSDNSVLQQLVTLEPDAPDTTRTFSTDLTLYLDLDGTEEEKLSYYETLNTAFSSTESSVSVQSRQQSTIEFYSMYGGFLFLGIFLGVLFLTATVLIIYYKQISEGYEDRRRFAIMQQVGMSRREVRETINAQVLLVFFLPLAAATLHILMAFSMVRKLLMLFALTDITLFILCTLSTLLVFSAIYALVYSITAKSYYKIVRGI